MATLTINFVAPAPIPYNGFVVKYRPIGTSSYTTVTPNPVSSPVVITGVTSGVSYEGTVRSDCGNDLQSPEIGFVVYASNQIYALYGTTLTNTCNATAQPVYVANNNIEIGPGMSVYTDPALTNLLTTPSYIMSGNGTIYGISGGIVSPGPGTNCA